PIEKSCRFIQSLLKFSRTLEPSCLKRAHIEGIVIERGQIERQVFDIEPSRRFVADQHALLQIAVTSLQGERLISSAKVETRYVEGDSSAGPSPSSRIGHARRLARLYFEPHAISKCVSACFINLESHVLVCGIALRILHRN